ncbi:hypothetical protein [Frigidibacter mobilis]|uniref:DUF4398 domain-containing protein n=1 Tax=Frigidibacter mobilis TaxID=1335048 RepID=A0A159Z686_9RHOB|nr:hypothetical protein [Frigidibacter mobilis]AMY69990.1 hypothetical protein AKL17_2751 [Frigidibacter mobilis]
MTRLALWLALGLIPACSAAPDLGAPRSSLTAQPGWPTLLPLAPVIAAADAGAALPDPTATEQARAEALRARAAAMQAAGT